jgi:uncharacterized protein (DUF2236 family)
MHRDDAVAFERHRSLIRARLRAAGIGRAGPGSVSWRVNRELIVLSGWARAILLQLAHPAIAAGLRNHSAYRGGILSGLRRLRATAVAMQAISFGDSEEMIAAAARVNAIHDGVRGPNYSAHDPHLQRWVHATLVESVSLAYERLVGPLTVDERDQYCREAAIVEPLLGIPPGWLPRDAAQLAACTHDMLGGGRLAVADTTRALARAILYPTGWRVAWPVWRVLQLVTIGSLPPSIRKVYGFGWSTREARALARWTGVLRTAIRWLPPAARHWPRARRLDRIPDAARISPDEYVGATASELQNDAKTRAPEVDLVLVSREIDSQQVECLEGVVIADVTPEPDVFLHVDEHAAADRPPGLRLRLG